jgi:regulator of cell morphogenesis and NO signaling
MVEKLREYRAHNNMRELIIDNNLLLMAISRFDIAFGFGDSSIREVCEKNNVDVNTFLAVCNLLSGNDYKDYEISLPSLIGYLKRAHTSFVDVTLPKIRHHLIEVINYSDTNDVSFLLMKFFDDYVVEVKHHMEHENNEVFGYVERLLAGEVDTDFDFSSFSVNHDNMATKLNELKDIFIYHYNQKDNARLSSVLFDIIVCGRDLISHFQVENTLFVPAVEKLEETLRSKHAGESLPEKSGDSEESPHVDVLGDREKDIIRCVAQGMANKEIADALCLSVHTVATHRRNISAKLGIHSTAGLTIFAILHNLVDLKDINPHQ